MEWVRIIVWAREKVVGTKGLDPGEFVMSSFELSGQLSIFKKEKFINIEEEEVAKAQEETTVNVFMELHSEVETLFGNLLCAPVIETC